MRVLFLAAEAAPLVKVGGLADVAGELPGALLAQGIQVQLVVPWHRTLNPAGLSPRRKATVLVPAVPEPLPAEVYQADLAGAPLWLIRGEPIDSSPSVYADSAEDVLKYAFFSLAAVAAADQIGPMPDVVHAHDWHAGMSVLAVAGARRSRPAWKGTATVLTIHNLAYMGGDAGPASERFGLSLGDDVRLPSWARRLPLPMGLAAADWLTTVSPTYAHEIQTADHGCGLEAFLSSRADHLTGILNGLDPNRWNPAQDEALQVRFGSSELLRRKANKAHLTAELGLATQADLPLLAMVTRLDQQKGADLALDALDHLHQAAWQFVLLGTGDPALEARARSFAEANRERARAVLRYDDRLARRIYAGADAILVPSRYEPCGLVQMIAMRYGCIPIVRATGGLKDTVREDLPADAGLGFVFESADPSALAAAIERALRVYKDPPRWQALQQRGMAQDFTWARSARAYQAVYRDAVAAAKEAA